MGMSAVIGGAILGGAMSDWKPQGILMGAAGGALGGEFMGAAGGAEGASLGAGAGAEGGVTFADIGASMGGAEAGGGLGATAGAGLGSFAESSPLFAGGTTAAGATAGSIGAGSAFSTGAGLDTFMGASSIPTADSLTGMPGVASPTTGGSMAGGGGIAPSSVTNIADQLKGLPWQGIAQGAQVGGNLLNMMNLQDYQKRVAQASQTADPFSQQRGQYQQQLQALMANPGSVTQSPGYQAQLEQGLQALQRTQGAQGFLGSGNAQQQNAQYAMQLQNQFYQQQLQDLMQLSGANIQGSPTAGSIQSGGAANIMGGQAQNLANLTYSLQNIANTQQPQQSQDQMGQNITNYLF